MVKSSIKKKINRKCIVCGRRMTITVDKDGYYSNGHFFGKLKLPMEGTGDYKKVGTSKLFGKKVNVVGWTGKEKELEYWECSSCY